MKKTVSLTSDQKIKLIYQKNKSLYWVLMCSATILEASDGESAFLLSATGVCQVRSIQSNHNPLVLVIKWANASFILVWVLSRAKTWPKIHYYSCNNEMPKAWAGIRTEVSSLSASQTVHGRPGISFFYSVPFFGSTPFMLIWTSWWSGKAIHIDWTICFQLKVTICCLAGKHKHLWKEELSGHLMLLSICNQHIWKHFKVSLAYICLHITKYCQGQNWMLDVFVLFPCMEWKAFMHLFCLHSRTPTHKCILSSLSLIKSDDQIWLIS